MTTVRVRGERSVTRCIAFEALHRLAGRALGGALSLVALHVAVRYFGAGQWGDVVAATAWVGIFAVLGEFGIATAGSRDLPDPEGSSPVATSATFVLGLSSSLVAALVMVVVALCVYHGRPGILHLVYALAPMVPFAVVWTIAGTFLSTYRRSDLRAVLDVLSSLLLVGAAVAVLEDRLDTTWYAVGLVCGTATTAVLAMLLIRHVVAFRLTLRGVRRALVERIAATHVVGIVIVSNLLYTYADIVLLSVRTTTSQVGYYGVASQVAGFAMTLPLLLLNPAVGRFVTGDDAERARLLQFTLDVLVGGVLPACVVLFIVARPVMDLIGGVAGAGATSAFEILLVATVLLFASSPVVSALVWTRSEGVAAKIFVLALVVNVGMNWTLDPRLGARGAALAMIASEAAVCIAGMVAYRSRTGFVPRARVPMLSAGAAAALAALWQAVRHL